MTVLRGTNNKDILGSVKSKDSVSIYGLLGNDEIYGGLDDDRLYGGGGNDKIVGDEGDDNIYGGMGADNLDGGAGDDFVWGSFDLDFDTLNGGDGDDRVQAQINDIALGGSGEDTLYMSQSSSRQIEMDLSKIGADAATRIGLNNIRAGQFERAEITLNSLSDGSSVVGSHGDDRIVAFLHHGYGSIPSIKLSGGAGDDYMQSNYSNSNIRGGSGDDRIYATGSGNEISGGSGDDIFIFNQWGRLNTIVDFGNNDFIQVESFSPFWPQTDQEDVLRSGSTPEANSKLGQFLYDTDNGQLFYDPDGAGKMLALHVFTLKGKPVLQESDFLFA